MLYRFTWVLMVATGMLIGLVNLLDITSYVQSVRTQTDKVLNRVRNRMLRQSKQHRRSKLKYRRSRLLKYRHSKRLKRS